jgi:hypothetical protein
MPARVDDKLVTEAAEALLAVAASMTNERGIRIRCPMDLHRAKSAVMAAMVCSLGYPNNVAPTGWHEITSIEELSK